MSAMDLSSRLTSLARFAVRFGSVLAVTALCGCKQSVDLAAVRAMAAAADRASGSFVAMSADFYESCSRQHSWSNLVVSAGQMTTLAQDCTAAYGAARQWSGMNKVLLHYYAALGQLAGNGDDGKSDYGLGELAKTIDALGNPLGLKDSQSAATLSSGLLHNIYAARRRSDIAQDADAASANVVAVTDVLKTIATEYYLKRSLRNEQQAIDNFFRPIPEPNPEPGTTYSRSQSRAFAAAELSARYALSQLRLTQRREVAAVDDRRAAVGAYVAALDALANANTKLLQSIHDNSASAVFDLAKAYFTDYSDDISLIDATYARKAPP